jgi:hypothetical protein
MGVFQKAKSTPLSRAQAFGGGKEVQNALAGNDPKYASSIYYRYQTETDPAAKEYLRGLVGQLQARGITPDKTVSWQGKSHNFFAQNPWIAPVAAALIPGVGPLAGAAIGAAGKLASGVGSHYKPSLGDVALGGLEGAAGGVANKLALGGKGLGGLPGLAEKAAPAAKTLIKKIAHDPLKAARYGLAAANVVQGANEQGRANQMLTTATAPFQAFSPDMVKPLDLSSTFTTPNPFGTSAGPGGGPPGGAIAAARAALQARMAAPPAVGR